MHAEDQARAARALAALSDEERDVVTMKVYANLTFERIAEALGEPLGTVTSRYHRALEKLRAKLETSR